MKNKKEKKIGKQVNMAKVATDQKNQFDSKQQEWVTELIKQEVAKMLKGTQVGKEGAVNFITSDFEGMANYKHGERKKGILDN